MLILIGGQKGGGGKTTIATNLAAMLVKENRDVLLYDVDPQRTATLWASRRDNNADAFSLKRINSSQKVLDKRTINVGMVIRNELLAISSKYEDIVIDAGGADNEALRSALALADFAIFPIIPSEFDMWTFDTLSNLVASAQGRGKELHAKVLLNKVNTNPATAKKEIDDCEDFLSDFENLKRFNGVLSERIAVRRASGKGMCTVEYRPIDNKAISEIVSVFEEIKSVR